MVTCPASPCPFTPLLVAIRADQVPSCRGRPHRRADDIAKLAAGALDDLRKLTGEAEGLERKLRCAKAKARE